MPSSPRTFCEQCLTDTTTPGRCAQHPYAHQLSAADPEERAQLQLMRRMQRHRKIPGLLLGLYVGVTIGLTVLAGELEPNLSLAGAFIFAHLLLLGGLMACLPLLAPLWFVGVIGQDLLDSARRRIQARRPRQPSRHGEVGPVR